LFSQYIPKALGQFDFLNRRQVTSCQSILNNPLDCGVSVGKLNFSRFKSDIVFFTDVITVMSVEQN